MKKIIIYLSVMVVVFSLGYCFSRLNNEKYNNDMFNETITISCDNNLGYAVEMDKVKELYHEISIRNNSIVCSNDKEYILISQSETDFNELPPVPVVPAGEFQEYKLIDETEFMKLYEVISKFVSPIKTYSTKYYNLYKKIQDFTIEVSGENKEKIKKVASYITFSDNAQTLEEQLSGISILDNRIIDTSKVKISEISNAEDAIIYFDINIEEEECQVIFPLKDEQNYLPILKEIENWRLIKEKYGYQIYYGYDYDNDHSLKFVKNGKEYFLIVSCMGLEETKWETAEYGGTIVYRWLSDDTIDRIIEEILNILE